MFGSGIRWLLAVLATVRLTWAVVYEDGPGEVLLKLRTWAGAYDYADERGPDGQPVPRSALGRALQCPYCVSLALALPMALLALVEGKATDALLAWLGLAGAAMLAIRWRPWR